MAPDEVSENGAESVTTLKRFLLCWLALAVLGWSIINPVMSFREILALQEELAAKSAVIESHERRLNAVEVRTRDVQQQLDAELKRIRGNDTSPRPPVKPPEERP